MRPLSTILLLSILAFAGACSKSNYAQVEPDDLYFTHKDRQASQTYGIASASATTDATYDYSAADVSTYTNQHSPVLYRDLGSPTIQLDEQPFYSASQNPDYLVGQNAESVEGVSDAYYSEDYASYDAVVTEEVPQTVNNYYGYPSYSNNYPRWGSPYSSLYYSPAVSLIISFGYRPYGYGYGYRPYRRNWYSYYGYPDFYNGYSNYYYSGYSYYGSYYNSTYAYCPPSYYNNNGYTGNYSTNGDGNNYGSNVTNYYGGSNTNRNTKIINSDVSQVTGPRVSRSSVSYYANKSHYDVIRRDNHQTGNEGGRIASDATGNRYTPVNRSGNSTTVRSRNLQANDVVRRQSASQSSGTIQRNNANSNSRYRSNTVNRSANNSRSRNSAAINRTNQGQTKTYVNRSSNGRSSTVNRSSNRQSINNNGNRSSRSSYTSPSRSSSNSSFNRSRSNSSYRSSGSNSGSRSSYSPRSSSVGRSSSSRSSAAPSRSSSSQSSSSRSSGSSSKSSSSRRKN